MTELFLEVLNLSISAGWLVFAVLVLRLLLKKAPKWVNVLLWAIVAVRLVLPVKLESEVSLIPSSQTVSPEIMMTAKPTIDTGIPVINDAVNPVISQSFAPQPLASANPLQILLPVAANLWLLGIIAMLLYTLITYLRLRINVRTAVRVRENIYQSERIASPFVLGIIKPRIYLPFSMVQRDMDYVIAHESAHIRRKDHWWKPLGFLILAVYWFNPLLWVGYILLCRDIEMACDEKVVKKLELAQRADYSQSLLNSSISRKSIAACPLAFGEVGVKARVKSVLNYKKPAFWIILVALIACIAVAVCFLTDPMQPQYMLGVRLEVEYPAIGESNTYWNFYELEKAYWLEIPYVYDAKLQILDVTEDTALVSLVSDTGEQSQELQVKNGAFTAASLFESENKKIQFSVVDVSRTVRQGNVKHWFGYGIHYFDSENNVSMRLPGRRNVLFSMAENGHDIIIMTDNGEQRQINMDIGPTAAYFCDLTGDGVAELCMTVTRGSGFVENYVMVYDYIKDKTYTMENRCVYDYVLLFEGGELIVTKHEYEGQTTVAEGALRMFKIETTGEYALVLQPVTYYSNSVPGTDVRSLAVGDYVLDKMIYGDHEQQVEKLHRLTKRINITKDKIFYDYGGGSGQKVSVDWNWKSATQLDEYSLCLRETAFYKQAKKKGYLYQHINGGYYLFKDSNALYAVYLLPDYNNSGPIIQIYKFVQA